MAAIDISRSLVRLRLRGFFVVLFFFCLGVFVFVYLCVLFLLLPVHTCCCLLIAACCLVPNGRHFACVLNSSLGTEKKSKKKVAFAGN